MENRYKQSGRSMMEMLGVLAIVGILSVGGIAGYSKAMMKMKINKLIQQITSINNNIQTLYINGQDYDFDTEQAIAAGIIPDDMIDEDGNVVNAFGGEVEVRSGTQWFGPNYYVIYFYGLPKQNMAEIGSRNWEILGNNLMQVSMCGSDWDRDNFSGYYFNGNPPKISDIIDECDGYGDTYIYFYFEKQ